MAIVLHQCQKEDFEAGWVEEGVLAVGSLDDARSLASLRREGITHVLTVAARLDVWVGKDGRTPVDPPDGIVHLQIDIDDHPQANLFSVLPECMHFIRGALGDSWPPNAEDGEDIHLKRAVLVHCASGISRSVAITTAFLMITARMSLDDALCSIRRNRSLAKPNIGFQYQLQCLEKAGGDITAAEKLFKEELKKEGVAGIAEVMMRQRKIANELHNRVDEAEETLMALTKAERAASFGHPVWAELISCVDALDRENSRAEGYIDRPAVVVRKSACSKAVRLLEGCPQSRLVLEI
uniref:protein-tyrosine-phosphatase n=1 Tax=Odontella aurita TaxID=265563 RepID=A0A7S4JB64_9STRA|mmetsp:Transcript_42996/g.130894  ORF Transcript_42996/g.130894 Transcript_42996/m.130894 type:complete len:295 (+) Transcript_42996:108-992(+)|eukprot:CAMPEP_0113583592 /NCGR_PEP_ID=MMETSP0015_2-20120614/32608_1 /TAXON_ID=2838 /ORGANISM="Odontella" /LENGTH=294 /DNA_ID=CAMNT_0000488497 /DNA_START=61 /DNA_END=945 /DNA_ORIENTATION=+ /assembly_acc=CAM_ASM_000160